MKPNAADFTVRDYTVFALTAFSLNIYRSENQNSRNIQSTVHHSLLSNKQPSYFVLGMGPLTGNIHGIILPLVLMHCNSL